MKAPQLYFGVGQVAFMLSFSESWVRGKLKEGAFPNAVDLGGDIRIPAGDVNALLESHRYRPDLSGISARSVGELRRKVEVAA